MSNNVYESPFSTRYGSGTMRRIFSPQYKYSMWRFLWVTLAEGERSLGLDISDDQIREMRLCTEDIPFDEVDKVERKVHHDVMAHLRVYASQCPKAAPIIHLGATSAYITDNADVVIMDTAARLILQGIDDILVVMSEMARKHKDTPILAYTHFQPAQPTTLGKRVCMWMQDLENDLARLKHELENVRILGCKGATGTCASFMELFRQDYEKVKSLDAFVSRKVNIKSVSVSGQTYSRKQDYYLLSVLSGVAQTLSKVANDLRLMSGKGEFHEPFGDKQVGSSAMAYKRNPINCEKVVSLARLVINNTTSLADTAANQWLERSLDDSAVRRILIPETFLALDEMLVAMEKVLKNGIVHEDVAQSNLSAEIPNMVSEGVLMRGVKNGGNRQVLHEIMRRYLLFDDEKFVDAVVSDHRFGIGKEEMQDLMSVDKLIGAAPKQVEEYLTEFRRRRIVLW